MRIAKARIKWDKQLKEYLVILKALPVKLAIIYKIIIIQRKTNNHIFYDIIFKKSFQLWIFIRKGYLTLIDIIYNTNCLYWKLFIVII